MKASTSFLRPARLNLVAGQLRTACAKGLLLLLLLVLPGVSQAQDYIYTTNNGTITITKYIGPGGEVTIPSEVNGLPVTRIGDWAFGYSASTSVTIPNSVITIGASTFRGCVSLKSVTIGKSVTVIGERAFESCGSLQNVIIPESVTKIGDRTFLWCTAMKAITVDAFNTNYNSVDGVLFDTRHTTLIQYPAGRSGYYTIPNNVTIIGAWSFSKCAFLTCVTIPNSVTIVGTNAFDQCTSLANVTIPDSVTRIRDNAFSGCYNLTSVTIGNGVNSIGDFAFIDCISLKFVAIPNRVTNINDYAFSGCTSLTSVTISNNVTSIGLYAFSGCSSLTSVTVPDSVTIIRGWAFYKCAFLTSVTIGNSVTLIEGGAFYDCTSLKGIYFEGLPPTVQSLVFYAANSVTCYYLPGTTGWGTTFADRPTSPWLLPRPVILNNDPSFGIQNNTFGFLISWATNASVVVEGCSNLANASWSPVSTNTLVGGTSYLSDPGWTNYPGRFYRIRSQ